MQCSCRYGLGGFYSTDKKPISLSRKTVEGIHLQGGTILGTSRGGADMKKIVQRITLWGLDMVFVIGGNGAFPLASTMHLLHSSARAFLCAPAAERRTHMQCIAMHVKCANDVVLCSC
jgi:6-phosphofructokinase